MSAFRACALLGAAILLLAAGCGADDESASTEAATGSEGGGTVIAALGDSITAGSPGFDPDPGGRQAYGFGDDERSSFGYWAERTGTRLEVRNCGVFGQRTDEIAARLDECADGADAVIVQGGINDIAQRYDVENAAANLRGIVQEAKEMGLPVAITDVLPWNNGYPTADPQIQALNLLIARSPKRSGSRSSPSTTPSRTPPTPAA